YSDHAWIAKPLAAVTRLFLRDHIGCMQRRYGVFDLATIVPTSAAKRAKRGFSPLERIIEQHGDWAVEWEPEALVKVETGGTRPARGTVDPSHYAPGDGYEVTGCNVLVFDDIWTSGSTVASVAQMLRNEGATGVVALTIGRQLDEKGSGSSISAEARETRPYNPDWCVICG
ncbi:MAG: hypothetical protein WEA81_06230, partial [Dehalococcoidia bacterium]